MESVNPGGLPPGIHYDLKTACHVSFLALKGSLGRKMLSVTEVILPIGVLRVLLGQTKFLFQKYSGLVQT